MKRAKRELEKVKELAKKYENEGYQVWIDPNKSKLPPFLRELNYVPDLLIKSEDENIIVEVKSSESLKNANLLEKVTQAIKDQRNWVFELVVTNPRQPEKSGSLSIADEEIVMSSLNRSEQLLQQQNFDDAAFLLAWVGFESAVRLALSSHRQNEDLSSLSLKDLARDAVIAGLVNRNDYEFIQKMQNIRNALVHGNLSASSISDLDVIRLIQLSKTLLAEENEV